METQTTPKPRARAARRLSLDLRKRSIEAMQGMGIQIIDGRRRPVCVVLPDQTGWFHHAGDVCLAVAASDNWRTGGNDG